MTSLPIEVLTKGVEISGTIENVSIAKFDKETCEEMLSSLTSKLNGFCISKPTYFDFLIEKCVIDPDTLFKGVYDRPDYYKFIGSIITDICDINPFLDYNSMFVSSNGLLINSKTGLSGIKRLVDNLDWNFPSLVFKYLHTTYIDINSIDFSKNFIVKHNAAEMFIVVKSLDEEDVNYLFKMKEVLSSFAYKKYFCYYSIYKFYYVYSCFVDFSGKDIPEVYDDLYRMVLSLNPSPFIERLLDDDAKNVEDDSNEESLGLQDLLMANNLLNNLPSLLMNQKPEKKKQGSIKRKQEAAFSLMSKKDIEALDTKLRENIFGQDEAIKALVSAVKRAKVGIRNADSPVLSAIFTGPTGVGKCQPLYSKIYTSRGWKTMGELEVGDSVLTQKGSYSKIVNTYPQYKKDIYRVEFVDGRYTDCSLEHLWKVYNADWKLKNKGNVWKTKTLKEILDMPKLVRDSLYIPLLSPKDTKKINLPIDPYIMGILLGDGSFRGQGIKVTTSDREIVERFTKYLSKFSMFLTKDRSKKYDYYISRGNNQKLNNYILDSIKNMGLMGKYSFEKSIPDIYKNSCYSQKLSLLKGLMDSDGFVTKTGSLQFYTTSEVLAKDVQELVWSIGGIAKIKNKQTYFTYNGLKKTGKPSFVVSIRVRNPIELVSLDRKRKNISLNYQYKNLKLKIKDIKKIGYDFTKCILIEDKEHLYITDNYIVTHNTECAKVLATELMKGKEAFIRIDCSEYGTSFEVSKLIGSPPGYVGHEEGGILVNKVIEYPFSVVLFDEIEKAHPKIYDILLQILDAGILTDSHGNTAKFNEAIIILTSNLASKEISTSTTPLGFGEKRALPDAKNVRGMVGTALKKHFKPEFLGRIDEVVVFNSLDQVTCEKIVLKELGIINEYLKSKGITIDFDSSVVSHVIKTGFNSEYGARPVIKTIKKTISDKVADALLESEDTKELKVSVDDAGEVIIGI